MKNYIKIGDLYWAKDKLPGLFTWDEAMKLTSKQFEAFVGPPPKGKKWSLPSKEEFMEAEKVGFRKNLNIVSGWFWSSSDAGLYSGGAWGFSGSSGFVDYYYGRDSGLSVRCVAR